MSASYLDPRSRAHGISIRAPQCEARTAYRSVHAHPGGSRSEKGVRVITGDEVGHGDLQAVAQHVVSHETVRAAAVLAQSTGSRVGVPICNDPRVEKVKYAWGIGIEPVFAGTGP